MSTSADFASIQASLGSHSIDRDLVLGRLCWYGVSETSIERDEFCRLMISVGLGQASFLPAPPKNAQVFRRVCTDSQRKRIATDDPRVYANYLVRDVGYDSGHIYKRIVREEVDTKTNTLLHDSELCTLTYDKKKSAIEVKCMTFTDQIARQMARDIEATFLATIGTLDGYAVRETIRSILVEKSNAINVRGPGGGVYFVNEAHGAHVDALEALALLVPGGKVSVHSLDLLSDDKQREMVRRAYESEAVTEIDRTIAEVTDLLETAAAGKGNPPKAKVSDYLDILNRSKGKDKEFHQLLEGNLGRSTSRIKILQRQLMKLSTLPAPADKKGTP